MIVISATIATTGIAATIAITAIAEETVEISVIIRDQNTQPAQPG